MEEHREKVHGLARMVMLTPAVLMIKDSRDSAEVNDDKSVEIQEAIESAGDVPREARKVARKSTKPPRMLVKKNSPG